MKLLFSVLFVLGLLSFSFATTYSGDGARQLNVSDSITSSNGFTVTVNTINWHPDVNQQPIIDNVNYDVSYDGSTIATPTLLSGESYTASTLGGTKNVTITTVSLGYATISSVNADGAVTLTTVPYANTKVLSKTYVAPASPPVNISVNFVSITSSPSVYGVTITWSTNPTSKGTVYLLNGSGGAVLQNFSDDSFLSTHNSYFSSLKSFSPYYFKITACTATNCINSTEQNFTTKPVIPVISRVNATNILDQNATIVWYTDVVSDSTVFYRRKGDTPWIQAPPPGLIDVKLLKDISVIDTSKIEKYVKNSGGITKSVNSSSGSTDSSSVVPSVINPSIITSPLIPKSSLIGYKATDKYKDLDTETLNVIIKQNHTIKLSYLRDNTTYEYFVQSCADQCANSTIKDAAGYVEPKSNEAFILGFNSYLNFRTKLSLTPPLVSIYADNTDIQHGSSVILTVSGQALARGASITSTALDWDDDDGHHTIYPKFGGDAQTFVPASLPSTGVVSVTFDGTGNHDVIFSATDSYGTTSSRTISINVESNSACSATGAKYYPSDTSCTDKWPNAGGAGINYNSPIGACHAYEVCSNDLDYMNADAESCCSAQRDFSVNPKQTKGYSYDKNAACDAAISNVKKKNPMIALNETTSMKLCKADYLVYAVGSKAVYMKDYYRAEACCADDSGICDPNKYPHFQASNPWPQSNMVFNSLSCTYTHYDYFFSSTNKPKVGWWASDVDSSKNNYAFVDAPAHSSVNILNTGTCVDYSFVVATALRKSGFASNEVMSVAAPGHLYNAVWLPGDNKYTFIDTVGNSGGEFFSGPGWMWNQNKTNHCSYTACSNDLGMRTCPVKGTEMTGC
ncbi:hypothetical protein HZC07_05490 [Candidatus Micrarchaeota archaeon]|nr:hypothetical protein [Candidatus Micrarchaeota archaeon]